MKSTILNTGCAIPATPKYQAGKCYLWKTENRSLVILCSETGGYLQGTIIHIIEKRSGDIDYVVGYYSQGWGNYTIPWFGCIKLETE